MSRPIACTLCKIPLGELAKGSRLRPGTAHICEACNLKVGAADFAKVSAAPKSQFPTFDSLFKEVFGGSP